MNAGGWALAIFTAIGIIAILYFGTLLIYFGIKKSRPYRRWLNEVIILVFAIMVCVVIRCAVIILAQSEDGEGCTEILFSNVAQVWSAFYQSIGVLAFEGLSTDLFGDETQTWVKAIFYGSAIYVGLVAVSIITVRFNYEIFSRVKNLFSFKKRCTDVYVFTAVTEDALLLADSICEKYSGDYPNDGSRTKKCRIIFAGSNLAPFDNKDEMHREIMRRGWLYISYYRKIREEKSDGGQSAVTKRGAVVNLFYKSIVGLRKSYNKLVNRLRKRFNKPSGETPVAIRLHLVKNNKRILKNKKSAPVIHIIAMALDENNNGDESTNSDIVFDDICAMLKYNKMWGHRAGKPNLLPLYSIEYYVLTGGKINYEFYDRRAEELYSDQYKKDMYDYINENEFYLDRIGLKREARTELLREGNGNAKPSEKIFEDTYIGMIDRRINDGFDYYNKKAGKRLKIRKKYIRGEKRQEKEIAAFIEIARRLLLFKKEMRRCFQINVFSEAYLSSYDLARKREGEFCSIVSEGNPWSDSLFKRDADVFEGTDTLENYAERYRYENSSSGEGAPCPCPFRRASQTDIETGDDRLAIYHVCVLGFGRTGQAAMDMVYKQTAYVKKGFSTQFVADAFDEEIENHSGIFAYEHPLYCCAVGSSRDEFLAPDRLVRSVIADHFQKNPHRIYTERAGMAMTANEVAAKMGFPVVITHKRSCTDLKFLRKLDSANDRTADGRPFRYSPRAYIISMDSDEKNIGVANALIGDIKREIAAVAEADSPRSMQIIYVQIRDDNDLKRLNWTDSDKEEYSANNKNLFVIPFGNRGSIYSYDSVIDENSAMDYNFIYDKVTKNPGEDFNNLLTNAIKNELPINAANKRRIGSSFGEIDFRAKRDKWIGLRDLFKQESNKAVDCFGKVYELIVEEVMKKAEGDRNRKSGFVDFPIEPLPLEKARWNRMYMAGGWVYGGKRDYRNKEHNCLYPFDVETSDINKRYDTANVFAAEAKRAKDGAGMTKPQETASKKAWKKYKKKGAHNVHC